MTLSTYKWIFAFQFLKPLQVKPGIVPFSTLFKTAVSMAACRDAGPACNGQRILMGVPAVLISKDQVRVPAASLAWPKP